MTSGRIGAELAVLAVFCILTIFLFPVLQGPYSAVNGPVSALQAARNAARVRLSIIQSALKSLGNISALSLVFLFYMGAALADAQPASFPACDNVLRC